MALNKSVILKLVSLLDNARAFVGNANAKEEIAKMMNLLGAEVGDYRLDRRQVQTTWTDYKCCDDGKTYRFRVIVEMEATDPKSNPFDVDHLHFAELMKDTGITWSNKLNDEDEDQDEDNGDDE